MNIIDILSDTSRQKGISIEVLPPLKGNGTETLFHNLDMVRDFCPNYINITTHHSEYVYRETTDGQYERLRIRRRPGTIAVAAAIQQRYDTPVVPHVICSGATKEDIEYELIDMQFLGINNVLLLRGDKAKDDKMFTPTNGGWAHTTELAAQVNQFNEGFFVDGSPIKHPGESFHYGVAAYPEKHEESPNLEMDMKHLKEKQDLGAKYAVTQLFYDNKKYFDFVAKARAMGITIPIIPGIKPLAKLTQVTQVPKTFHCDMPQELAKEALKCASDEEARQLGIEWAVSQCKELYANGVKDIHFYTVSAFKSMPDILRQIL